MVVDRYTHTFVGLSLRFRPDDANSPDFGRGGDMRATIRLPVESDDVDDSERVDRARDEVGLEADQRWVTVGVGARYPGHAHREVLRDDGVDRVLDLLRKSLRHRGELEVEPGLGGRDLCAGDVCAVLAPDDAVHDVLGGMQSHDHVAPRPVETAGYRLSDVRKRSCSGKRVPYDALAVLDDACNVGRSRRQMQPARVVRLASTRGKEGRRAEGNCTMVVVDSGDVAVETSAVGVRGIQQLGRLQLVRHVRAVA